MAALASHLLVDLLFLAGAVLLLRQGWRVLMGQASLGSLAVLTIGLTMAASLSAGSLGLTSARVTSTGASGSASTFAVDVPADGFTPTTWAVALLGALGDPTSAENVRAVTAWERAEGGAWQNTAAYNPLNTTQREPGSWSMNSVGVQAYTSWQQGMAATVTTLQNGRYGGVLSALHSGDCAACVAAAVGASPWGTGRFAV